MGGRDRARRDSQTVTVLLARQPQVGAPGPRTSSHAVIVGFVWPKCTRPSPSRPMLAGGQRSRDGSPRRERRAPRGDARRDEAAHPHSTAHTSELVFFIVKNSPKQWARTRPHVQVGSSRRLVRVPGTAQRGAERNDDASLRLRSRCIASGTRDTNGRIPHYRFTCQTAHLVPAPALLRPGFVSLLHSPHGGVGGAPRDVGVLGGAPVGVHVTRHARRLARRLASHDAGRTPPGAPPWRFWAPGPRFSVTERSPQPKLQRASGSVSASSSQPGHSA
jgi:hypothetical protein